SYTEYLAGLYVGNLRGEKAFDEVLEAWRDNAELVPDGGNIWMGLRGGKWYTPTIYSKGPYVLHMLRLNMQAQFGPEEGDKRFLAPHNPSPAGTRTRAASTNALIAVINETTKSNHPPFSKQWFHS